MKLVSMSLKSIPFFLCRQHAYRKKNIYVHTIVYRFENYVQLELFVTLSESEVIFQIFHMNTNIVSRMLLFERCTNIRLVSRK